MCHRGIEMDHQASFRCLRLGNDSGVVCVLWRCSWLYTQHMAGSSLCSDVWRDLGG